MTKLLWISVGVVMLSAATPLLAQGGCVNSPEAPTLALGLAGSVGFALTAWKNRRR